jgi:hypothetical protein
MKNLILREPLSGWIKIGVPLLIYLMMAACATTGPGVNRNIVFQQTPKIILPYKVVVKDASKSAGTLEDRSGIMRTSRFGPVFGLAGVAADAVIDSAQGPPDQITEKESRGRFRAGEAFDAAVRAVSSTAEDAPVTMKLELMRAQPMLQKNCYPGCPRLSFDLQFSATFVGTGKTTTSYYSFAYPISAWGFFGATREKDVLRELTEYAVAHWAQQLSAEASRDNGEGSFPAARSEREDLGNVQCQYNIFVRPE